MKLRVMLGGTIALVSAAVLAGRAGGDAEKTPTIKDVTVKVHEGAHSQLAQLQGALRAEEPAWEKIQDRSKDFVNLGAVLAKNEPPRGDLESWKKLSAAYFQDAKALDDAAKAHDRAAAEAAQQRLSASLQGVPQGPREKLTRVARGARPGRAPRAVSRRGG